MEGGKGCLPSRSNSGAEVNAEKESREDTRKEGSFSLRGGYGKVTLERKEIEEEVGKGRYSLGEHMERKKRRKKRVDVLCW